MKYSRFLKIEDRVHGWITYEACILIEGILKYQHIKNIEGDILEIGVHQGKSSIILSKTISNNENFFACDIFENQTENLSLSGWGNKELFLKNMSDFNPKVIDRLVILEKNSSDLKSSDVSHNLRLAHIDGGHTKEETENDLIFCSEHLGDRGIIVIDDMFNQNWPGVTEGVISFLQNYTEFTSLLIGFNKLMIARKNVNKDLVDYFTNLQVLYELGLSSKWQLKSLNFMGTPLNIIYLPSYFSNSYQIESFKKRFLYKLKYLGRK